MDAPASSKATSKSKNKKHRNSKNATQSQPSRDASRQPTHRRLPAVATDGISKSKLKKQRREQRQQAAEAADDDGPSTSGRGPAPQPAAFAGIKAKGGGKGGSLLDKMRQRLQGGRFRWLNEKLYTCQGGEALSIMRQEPELYAQYHEGFREQTKGWPTQPVDVAIRWLSQKPPTWVVADLGCGDARLAASVPQAAVHSYDLVATAPGVVPCNMAALPLGDGCLDAAVFCLSLMGTDYGAFLEEAARVVRPGGWLWIAEVQSRFMNEGGNSVIDPFVSAVKGLRFELKAKDLKNPYFLTLQFQKKKQEAQQQQQQQGPGRQAWPALRACQYKKR